MKFRILLPALSVAAILAVVPALYAQDAAQTPTPAPANTPPQEALPPAGAPTPAPAPAQSSTTFSNQRTHRAPRERVQQTKDTKQEIKKTDKYNALLGKDEQLPDKQLYDKALLQEKSGHFDIARLDLQTLLNTYPDSQYQMRAKLAVADCWYREGGTAALTQAEQEYKDFITFFPNAPEAAEAQMRVGDIYFKQMDVPDRDYTKAIHAEEEYRTMLKQYPDAPPDIIKEAKQKLREVQEVLAVRESELAAFYSTHNNWQATIARYQTVVDTYPQYSHMDDTLIGLGDAYEAEANIIRAQPVCQPNVRMQQCFTEGAKAQILQEFDNKAADAYRNVVLLHCAAPHVEDAKERLVGMNLPVPTPTKEQCEASEALEGSRAQYTMTKRLEVIFMHRPDTVTAAQAGEPPLDDAPATTAPAVGKYFRDTIMTAATGAAPHTDAAPATSPAAAATPSEVPAPPPANAAPTLSDVPPAAGSASDASINTLESAPKTSTGSGTNMGVEILSTGSPLQPTNTPNADTVNHGSGAASNLPAATGAPDANNGLTAVGPRDTSSLPAVQAPAAAPDAINDAAGHPQPAAAPAPASGKGKAPTVDKNDESSSKNKPKKGIDKLNPF